MRTTFVLLFSLLFTASLSATDKRYTRAEALGQLQTAYKNSQVAFVAKMETRGGQRFLVCLEVLKSSRGLPLVREAVLVTAALRGPEGREGIVFMPIYPFPGFAGEIRWLRDGNLNECRELSLVEIKAALRATLAEAPAPGPRK
jgi:hypothetical protein